MLHWANWWLLTPICWQCWASGLSDLGVIFNEGKYMTIQDTIVELFEAKRIDKTIAYRLLSEAKKESANAVVEAPKSIKIDLTFGVSAGDPRRAEVEAMAAWVYLLYVITGQSDIIFDYVATMGALAMRTQIQGKMTLDDVAQNLALQLASAAASGEAASFAWIAANASDAQPSRLMRLSYHSPANPGDGFRAEIEASPSLEIPTLSQDWPDTLRHLNAEMARHPSTPFEELDLLPSRHKLLLQEYNCTRHFLPPNPTVAAVLDPVLAKLHSETAVLSNQGNQSYGQYKQYAYQMANLLRYLGVVRNECVMLMVPRTNKLPALVYGIVCAGAAYVPLETDMPWERVLNILGDTRSEIFVTDAATLYTDIKLDQTSIRKIVCTDVWPRPTFRGIPVHDRRAIESCNGTPPSLVNRPGDAAYILFTSGSTGKPKGVTVTNLNLVNTLIGINNKFGVAANNRIMCFSSYGFDLSAWDMFGSILAGASVFIPTKMEIRDPYALLAILREQKITIWNSVPTGMQQLLLSFEGKNIAPVESLRLALLGGEFIPPTLPADLLRLFPNCLLANMGGATEVTIYSNYYYPVPRFEPHWKSIPYGRPLPNQTMYVLNDSLMHCSIGEKGMIFFGGLSVAAGYYGDEQKTRDAFIPAPWPDESGGMIYRTGDLGILHADGQMEICGRADNQVKVRGFRVELGEIESQMYAISGIDQVAVIAKSEGPNKLKLMAFYTSREGEISAESLRSQLAVNLPEYMIPSQFVFLDNPPIGASGKLDRKALQSHLVQRDEIGQDYTKPKDGLEEKLSIELARILKLDLVGVDDDFFLIGGDSLISLQYLAVLSEMGFKASPIVIQQGRTIRGVLERVTLEQQQDASSDSINGRIPLSPMARRFFERLPMVDRNHWNQMMIVGFDHLPDVDLLNQSINAVFQNHPVMRATFQNGEMVADTRPAFALEVVDLRHELFFLRPMAFTRAARKLQTTTGTNGKVLANAILVLLSPRDARLVWVLHQTIVDANCWRIVVEDMARAYRQPGARLLRSVSYANYVEMVRVATPAAIMELGKKAQYPRMPVPRTVPYGDTSVSNTEGEGVTVFRRVSAAETQQILDLIRPGVVSNLNFFLLTALAFALSKWSGEKLVRFDVISNGRSVDPTHDYSRTIGWFATHNPFEVAVPENLNTVLANIMASWQIYQEYSPLFVAVGNDVRGNSAHTLGKQTDQALLYSHLGDFDSLDMPIGWTVGGSAAKNRGKDNPRTHDLEFETMIVGGHLMIRLVYGSKLVSRRQANQLLSLFNESVQQLVVALKEKVLNPS